jgi:hypothetical protein
MSMQNQRNIHEQLEDLLIDDDQIEEKSLGAFRDQMNSDPNQNNADPRHSKAIKNKKKRDKKKKKREEDKIK